MGQCFGCPKRVREPGAHERLADWAWRDMGGCQFLIDRLTLCWNSALVFERLQDCCRGLLLAQLDVRPLACRFPARRRGRNGSRDAAEDSFNGFSVVESGDAAPRYFALS